MRKIVLLLFVLPLFATANQKISLSFTVSMQNPAAHTFHVILHCSGLTEKEVEFKLPNWSPGYYQMMNYADNVEHFSAKTIFREPLSWKKTTANGWLLQGVTKNTFIIEYDVKTTRQFVASNYLDAEHGYIIPASMFLHIADRIDLPATVTLEPYTGWNNVATGLDPVNGKPFTYSAPDFDVLYDSPILIGSLEELPSFTVRGVPHYFLAYKGGNFDKAKLMNNLKKIVETAVDLIGDIPYKHYTFIAIGPGRGGIEHLNSTTISFDGNGLKTDADWLRILHFIAHEYFHHYNVKRIRPIELGPFDYDKGSPTNMLWVSEGLSVYYEYLLVRRAGLCSDEELLQSFRGNMLNYENKPGHYFQSLTQSSYETWSDGPQGRVNDEVNKTISYYDKGPVVGLMLDFAIRHNTSNKKSLDDVMRLLYKTYYQKKKRGFTEAEFRAACENIAGEPLTELFEYVSTVKAPDYPKYFAYGGLSIDTTIKEKPGAYSGIAFRQRKDTLSISAVDWPSPAWEAGVRQGNSIVEVEGQAATQELLERIMKTKQPGDILQLVILQHGERKTVAVTLSVKREKEFIIKEDEHADALAKEVLRSWMGR
jgi:predicted metalloprotease with PDZ domain